MLHIANYAAFVAYAGALWISLKSRFLLLLLSVKMSPLSVACAGDASSRVSHRLATLATFALTIRDV